MPLGHGTTIQPACAALFGLILASRGAARAPDRRSASSAAPTIIAGLLVFGAESLTTIGSHGVGGDLLFVTAGVFWATFGIAAAAMAACPGMRAIAVVGALSILMFAPLYVLFVGYRRHLLRMSLAENLMQVVVQGLLAGALPIYLFARAVILLGAGRAAMFPALVPGFGADHRLSRARRRAEPRRSSSAW